MLNESLAKVFPREITCTKSQAAFVAAALTDVHRRDVPFGSSFCVVSGIAHPEGLLSVWLTVASFAYLVSRNVITLEGRVIRRASRRGPAARHT